MVAKMIVPWFGGAAGVWACCLLFFQALLFLGYLYAHWLSGRFQPKIQGQIHAAFLAMSLLALPIIPRAGWRPSGLEDPTLRILILLAATVGLPYFLLSATSPLLQAWYVRSRAGARPYRFFALSSLGSMLALASYPTLIEPEVSTRHQAVGWSAAYASVVVLLAAVVLGSRRERAVVSDADSVSMPGFVVQLLWTALPACTSALLLAVTNHLSQNVAAIPLLWVLPLALYLLSFILCFEGRAWYHRNLFLRLLAMALGGMTYALYPEFLNASLALLLPLYLVGLFICCMVCHGELALLKPHASHLTRFYLMVSLGGALGGVFVALLAPRLFSGYYELPLGLGACAVLVPAALYANPTSFFYKARSKPSALLVISLALALIVSLFVAAYHEKEQARVMVRNFYGVLRVIDYAAPQTAGSSGYHPPDDDLRARKLMNGTIDHGLQFLSPALRREPTSYYGPDSGVALALKLNGKRGPLRVGVVGLGAGTLAAYSRAGDRYTFYEINPLVVRLAQTEFSYLSDSPAEIDIIPGDARLSLERQPPQAFDVLAVDAFSGDAIPVHLLTREAFALYFRHLKPSGVLAVHISNSYVDLEPVVEAAALSLGKQSIEIYNEDDRPKGIYRSTWALMTGDTPFAHDPEIDKVGEPLKPEDNLPLWTDDYSSLFRIMKWAP